MNYTAIVIEKLILDDVKAEIVDILFELCSRQNQKIAEMVSFFRNTPTELSGSILAWLECSNIYYKMICLYALYLKNNHMVARNIERTKEIEVIYFENNMLANAILDTKDIFVAMAEKLKAAPNLAEFPKHGLSFFNDKMERELKKSITTFECVKGDLNVKRFVGMTVDALLNANFKLQEEDKIEKKLLEDSGLTSSFL